MEIYSEIINKIEEFEVIIVHTHVNPDGDALGSAFGLKGIINETYPEKEVYVIGDKTKFLSFLGDVDDIEDSKYNNALVIVVDTPIKKRVFDDRFENGKFLIKIDHHRKVESFGDIEIVQEQEAATALIICDILINNKNILKINKTGANSLLTGIITDTGWYRYNLVNADTFKKVSYLYENKAEGTYINEKLSVITEGYAKYKGYVLQNFKKTPNNAYYFIADRKTIRNFDIKENKASQVVGELGNLENCKVWCVIRESDDEIYKVSIRSKAKNIRVLAEKYNGGGHDLASGAIIKGKNKINIFLDDLDKICK